VKLSSMIMFNSDLIQTMIHFLFAIAILLLLSMTRHPASVFTARFQDCEFVYHVLAQVVTMLHLTYHPPASKDTNIVIEINYINITKLLLFYRGEPRSPVRVHCTRLHAMRANLNTHFLSHQKYYV